MSARNDEEKGRQHAFSPPTKSSDIAPTKKINVHVYVHAHVDLPTCDKISERKSAPTSQPAT